MTAVTWSSLLQITQAFALAQHDHDVYIFGSSAQTLRESGGSYLAGNDLDVVVTVDEEIYYRWTAELMHRMSRDADLYFDAREVRLELAMELLGIERDGQHYRWIVHQLNYDTPIDVHLMPKDWLERTLEIQGHLPHSDQNFVENIARDAIRIPTEKMFIEWQRAIVRSLQSPAERVVRAIGETMLLGYGVSLPPEW